MRKTVNKLKKPTSPGIIETVIALNILTINIIDSCWDILLPPGKKKWRDAVIDIEAKAAPALHKHPKKCEMGTKVKK